MTRTKQNVKADTISAEDYPRNEIVKLNKHQTDNMLSELLDLFA